MEVVTSKLEEAGFTDIYDFISLTPRTMGTIGVQGLGTRLKLARVIDSSNPSTVYRREMDILAGTISCGLRLHGKHYNFRLPSSATISDLKEEVSDQLRYVPFCDNDDNDDDDDGDR